MSTVIHIIDYLYLNKKLNINNIIINNDYTPTNKILHKIDSTLTDKELYYFELLNNHIDLLFDKIETKNGQLQIHNSLINLDKYTIHVLVQKFNMFFCCNNELQKSIDSIMSNNIIPKYIRICVYLLFCNIFKLYNSIDRFTLHSIINTCTTYYDDDIINDILSNVRSCELSMDDMFYEKNHDTFVNAYLNYNKLITNKLLFNVPPDYNQYLGPIDVFIFNHFNTINNILMNKLQNYQILLDFIYSNIQISNSRDDIILPKGLIRYLNYIFNSIDINEWNTDYVNLIIDLIINKNKDSGIFKEHDTSAFFIALMTNLINRITQDYIDINILKKLDLLINNFTNIFKKYNCDNLAFLKKYIINQNIKPDILLAVPNNISTNNHIFSINMLYHKYFCNYNFISILDCLHNSTSNCSNKNIFNNGLIILFSQEYFTITDINFNNSHHFPDIIKNDILNNFDVFLESLNKKYKNIIIDLSIIEYFCKQILDLYNDNQSLKLDNCINNKLKIVSKIFSNNNVKIDFYNSINIDLFLNLKINECNDVVLETLENKNNIENIIKYSSYTNYNRNLFIIIFDRIFKDKLEYFFIKNRYINELIKNNKMFSYCIIELLINTNKIAVLFHNFISVKYENDHTLMEMLLIIIIKLNNSNIINTIEYLDTLSNLYCSSLSVYNMHNYSYKRFRPCLIFLLLEQSIFTHFTSNVMKNMVNIYNILHLIKKFIQRNTKCIIVNKKILPHYKEIYDKNYATLQKILSE